jgi:hypothetical protein
LKLSENFQNPQQRISKVDNKLVECSPFIVPVRRSFCWAIKSYISLVTFNGRKTV